MLTDSQMQRLAEMCRWADYSSDGRAYADYRRLTHGVMAFSVFDKDKWQLTPAGYFTVIKVLGLEIDSDKNGWNIYAKGHGGEEGIFGHAGSGGTLDDAIDAALEEIL